MIQSMTTFARCSDQGSWGMATWEIKVVNHRYFDCIIKMPEAFRSLEANIRLQLQQRLQRGRVECFLRFTREEQNDTNLILNTELIKKLTTAIGEIKNYLPTSPVDPMRILSWPQVVQETEVDFVAAQEAVLQLFEKSLADLVITGEREGISLAKVLKDKLQEVLTIVDKVKAKAPQALANQRLKVIKKLEEVATNLDQSRLEQEMVYFAQKIDVAEEIDRLEMHAKEVIRILDGGGTVGKRLDFLMQELNREANTLTSKSTDIEITQLAVELKVLIEQMREQVQNIV